MFYVYAIYNSSRKKIYIGHTAELDKRLKRHNGMLRNKSTSFTSRNSGDWRLIHQETFNTRQEAMSREKELKSFRGREFIRGLIKQFKK